MFVQGTPAEIIDYIGFPGTVLDSWLQWNVNTEQSIIVKHGQQRVLYTLNSFLA